MSRILDALNASGVGNNWLSGNVNMAAEGGSKLSQPKPSFLGGLAHSMAEAPGAIGGFLAHTVTDPVNGVLGLAKGIKTNLGLQGRLDAVNAHNAQIDKADTANTQAYKNGTISKAEYRATTAKLLAQYQDASAQAKQINADHYGAAQVAGDYVPVATAALTLAAPFLKPAAGAAAAAGARGTVQSVANKAVTGLEKSFGTGGANIATAPGVLKTGAKIAGRGVITQLGGSQVIATGRDFNKGNYGGAALNALGVAAPVVISGASKAIKVFGAKLGTAMYGKEGFFGAVIRGGGPDMLKHLDGLTPAAAKRITGLLRQVQQYNLDQFDGNTKQAAAHFVEYLKNNGRDLAKMDAKGLEKELSNWVSANKTISNLHASGELRYMGKGGKPGDLVQLKDGQRLIAARFDAPIKNQIRTDLVAAKGAEGRLAVLEDYAKSGADWTKNPNLMSKLKAAAASGDAAWKAEFEKTTSLKGLFTDSAKGKLPSGYVPSISKTARADFKAVKDTAVLDYGKKANVVLGKVGAGLKKVGLDTQAADPMAHVKFKANFAGEIGKIEGLDMKPSAVSSALRNAANDLKGVADERQLSVTNIKNAIPGIDHAQAAAIKKAYLTAYSKMTTADLGLAGKIDNKLYNIPGYGKYRAIQGRFRYESNPFFRTQETTETEIMAQIVSGGKSAQYPGAQMVNRIFGGGKDANRIDKTISVLREKNIFAGGGFGGSGANSEGFSQISAKLNSSQERSIAGIINSMADGSGKHVADFVEGMTKAEMNNVRQVVQYTGEGFSSSHFVRTLNLVAFPTRYNVKLAGILGRALAKASPTTQIATIKVAADMHTFMKSDEGIKWAAQNSEALGIISYLNPLANLNTTFKLIMGDHVGPSDFGQLGGLPLGFFAAALKDTGVIPNHDAVYLNPKTGEVIPDKLPATTGGYVKTVIADFISSMYSFPGRTFGTTISKTQLTKSLPGLKDKNGEMVDAPTKALSPEQIRIQQVLGAGKGVGTKPPKTAPNFQTLRSAATPLVLPKINIQSAPKAPRRKI